MGCQSHRPQAIVIIFPHRNSPDEPNFIQKSQNQLPTSGWPNGPDVPPPPHNAGPDMPFSAKVVLCLVLIRTILTLSPGAAKRCCLGEILPDWRFSPCLSSLDAAAPWPKRARKCAADKQRPKCGQMAPLFLEKLASHPCSGPESSITGSSCTPFLRSRLSPGQRSCTRWRCPPYGWWMPLRIPSP